MNQDITKLIDDLELNHEYCPKDVILQAAAELRGMQDRIQLLYKQLNEAESRLDAQYKMGMEAEREACAEIVRDNADGDGLCCADDLLAAIRARGQA